MLAKRLLARPHLWKSIASKGCPSWTVLTLGLFLALAIGIMVGRYIAYQVARFNTLVSVSTA